MRLNDIMLSHYRKSSNRVRFKERLGAWVLAFGLAARPSAHPMQKKNAVRITEIIETRYVRGAIA